MWFEPLVILGVGVVISFGLYAHYQPKISKMKKSYNEFNSKVRENLINMSDNERKEFFSNMPKETKSFFQGILNNDYNFQGIEEFQTSQYHLQQIEHMHQDQFQDFSQWAMDESLKAVTPFDYGGYVQGPGFNPSDTFAHDSMNHMDHMNSGMDHINSGMDSFNGF